MKSAKSSKRPGRVQRRHDLLGVVYDVVSESGIDGASMRQIAERAKVSTGTINYHFSNKEKLIMAALQAAYQTPTENEDASGSPLAKLKSYAFSYIFRSSEDRFWRFWINYLAHGTRDPDLRRHQSRRFEKQHSYWLKLMQEARDRSEIRADVDVAARSMMLITLAHGLVIRQTLQPDTKTRAECTAILEGFFREIEVSAAMKRGGSNGRAASHA